MPFWKGFIGASDFKVKPIIHKLRESSTIIKEEKLVLSLNAPTYGVPVTLDEEERGIVFLGGGDYLVDSRIRTYAGVYAKQYIDSFRGWGVIIGEAERWAEANKQFVETKEIPNNFSSQEDFIKEAEKTLYRAIGGNDTRKSIERADWFYEVKGEKDKATLHYKGGKIVFKGCHAKLVSAIEKQVVLKEGDAKLVLHGDKIVLKSKEGKLVASGEKIVSDIAVISGNKIVTKGFVGKHRELVEKAKIEALSLLTKVLEKLGYKLE